MPVIVAVRCRNSVLPPYSEQAFTVRISKRIAFLSPCVAVGLAISPSKRLCLIRDSQADVLLLYLPCHLHVLPIESPLTCQDFRLSHRCVFACIYLAVYMSTPSKALLLVKIFDSHTGVFLLVFTLPSTCPPHRTTPSKALILVKIFDREIGQV